MLWKQRLPAIHAEGEDDYSGILFHSRRDICGTSVFAEIGDEGGKERGGVKAGKQYDRAEE